GGVRGRATPPPPRVACRAAPPRAVAPPGPRPTPPRPSGGHAPRNESRQGTLRSSALTRFGCCGVRHNTPPTAPEERRRPHCVGGTPPRNESRQGTLRSPALTRFGCCGVRHHTPPTGPDVGRGSPS